MWERLRRWFDDLPYTDALERRQALLLQTMELGLLITAILLIPFPLVAPMAAGGRPIMIALVVVVALFAVGAVWLLRVGRAQSSAMLLASVLSLLLSGMLYGTTLADGAATMFAFALPIVLGGLLAGRWGLLLTVGLSCGGVTLALLSANAGLPGAGFARAQADVTIPTIILFVIIAGLLGLFIDSLRSLISATLLARRSRERELETLSRRLEAAVRERTADLEMALKTLEQRAAEQQRLLTENEAQQAIIRELSVPVLPLGASTAVMPLVGALDAGRLDLLQTQALSAIKRLSARRLLLDITGVPVVDTYVAQGLLQTVQAARLLGAEVVLVGVRPEVAQSVVGLGVDLRFMRSFADLQTALATLRVDNGQ